MHAAKNLWAYIQGDPVFMRRVNGWLTIFWIVMIPISYALGWLSSVAFVSALSLWALVSGHWAAWQAARVEVAQEREIKRERQDPSRSVWSSALSTRRTCKHRAHARMRSEADARLAVGS
jgi:hypothetical protein